MATLTASELADGISRHFSWAPFAAVGDVSPALEVIRHTRMTAQVVGTYTGGLTLIAEGSLEDTAPTNFFPLTNGLGDAVSFTANGGMIVGENVKWIRLRATAGTGGASVTGYLLAVI